MSQLRDPTRKEEIAAGHLIDAMTEACCPLDPEPKIMVAACAQLCLTSFIVCHKPEHALESFDDWVVHARAAIVQACGAKQ